MFNIWPNGHGYLAIMSKLDSMGPGKHYGGMESLVLDSTFSIQASTTIGDTNKWYGDWAFVANSTPDGLGNFWYIGYCRYQLEGVTRSVYGKLDSHGDTLFERVVPIEAGHQYPWHILALPNGRAMLSQYAFHQNRDRTRLFFFEADGSLIKSDSILSITPAYQHGAYPISVDFEEQKIFIPTMDYIYMGTPEDYLPRIFVYDFQGNRILVKNSFTALLGYRIGFVRRTAIGGYLAMGDRKFARPNDGFILTKSALIKLDDNLELEWTREFWHPDLYNSTTLLESDSDGNFFLGGILDTSTVDSQSVYRAYLMKLGPKLDSLWLREFYNPDDPANLNSITLRWPAQIQTLPDHSILMLTNNFIGSPGYSLLYKLDSCGFLIERCNLDSISPSPPDTMWPDPYGGMLAYPNPSSGIFGLAWDVFRGDASNLRVVDMTGRELWYGRILREERPSRLNLTELGAGTYFLEITSSRGRVFRTKVTVLH